MKLKCIFAGLCASLIIGGTLVGCGAGQEMPLTMTNTEFVDGFVYRMNNGDVGNEEVDGSYKTSVSLASMQLYSFKKNPAVKGTYTCYGYDMIDHETDPAGVYLAFLNGGEVVKDENQPFSSVMLQFSVSGGNSQELDILTVAEFLYYLDPVSHDRNGWLLVYQDLLEEMIDSPALEASYTVNGITYMVFTEDGSMISILAGK